MNGMDSGFHLLAAGATTQAGRTDALMTGVTALCGLVALGVALTIVTLAIRYRAGAQVDRRVPSERKTVLEMAWTVTLLLVFLGLFALAAHDFVTLYRVPPNALPVYAVGKQWMWKLQHANGRREVNELHVPVDQAVQLILSSQDVIHSFDIPAFRIKQDVVPGRYTRLWFKATRVGQYHLFCAEYCGTDHSGMVGRVVVMPQADYAAWLRDGTAEPGLARQGLARFSQLGCAGCHGPGGAVHAPSLEGLLGRTVHLADGRSIVADENYVRDAILLPSKDVVAGYQPVMPSFAGQVTEEDIAALIAFMRAEPAGPTSDATAVHQGGNPS